MDYEKASTYWTQKDQTAVRLDRDKLFSEIEQFILSHNTCALATGSGEFVRCTPIEYSYWNKIFWMLSEGGLKFRGLQDNKHVNLAIYNEYRGFGQLGGMQITGTATLVEPWTAEYVSFLTFKNISADSLKKLATTLYLIQVTPTRIDFLNAEFKQRGFDPRQHL